MSISDLYSSGFRERNRDHFASIVRVALADGDLTTDEKSFLDRLARNLDVSDDEYAKVLEDPAKYPINPPLDQERRIERLYDIVRMVYVDEIETEKEMRLLKRLCVGLGFPLQNIDKLITKAMELIHHGATLDTFEEELQLKKLV